MKGTVTLAPRPPAARKALGSMLVAGPQARIGRGRTVGDLGDRARLVEADAEPAGNHGVAGDELRDHASHHRRGRDARTVGVDGHHESDERAGAGEARALQQLTRSLGDHVGEDLALNQDRSRGDLAFDCGLLANHDMSLRDDLALDLAGGVIGESLSDDAIVKLLVAKGITIARRTVAKYREQLGIESSSRPWAIKSRALTPPIAVEGDRRRRRSRVIASASAEISTTCTRLVATPASISVASLSPLPHPSSTSSTADTPPGTSEAPWARSKAVSARVMGYHGRRQIASKSWEPRAS